MPIVHDRVLYIDRGAKLFQCKLDNCNGSFHTGAESSRAHQQNFFCSLGL